MLYQVEIEEFYTDQPFGRNDGQWQSRRRHLLIEAADIHAAFREAARVGEANAMMGPRHLGIEVLSGHSVALPAAIECPCR